MIENKNSVTTISGFFSIRGSIGIGNMTNIQLFFNTSLLLYLRKRMIKCTLDYEFLKKNVKESSSQNLSQRIDRGFSD